MRGKAILFLILIAAGLGAVLYLTDERPPIEEVAETRLLDDRSLRQASRIRWQFQGRQAIELGRDERGRFVIQEPIVDVASMAYLVQIINAWDSANIRETGYEDDEAGRAKAGLSPPELELIAEWPDGKRLAIDVGGHGPLGTTRFLRREGRIWEGGEALLSSLHLNLDDLRERSVFEIRPSQADELQVDQLLESGRRETLHLVRQGQDWRLRAPIEGRADPDSAQGFVTAVLSMKVNYFQPPLVRRPDRDPDLRIRVESNTDHVENLELWLEQGQLWGLLEHRTVLFIVDNVQYGSIFKNAADRLRARILVPLGDAAFEQLEELVVDPGQGRGERQRFVRKGTAWRMVEPIEYAVHPTPMNEAITSLNQLVAREFVTEEDGVQRPRAEDPRYGLRGADRLAVSTRRGRDHEMRTLWLGGEAPDAGHDEPLVYAARADEPDNIAMVPKRPLAMLQRPWTVYCDKTICKLPAMSVQRLRIDHRDGRSKAFHAEQGRWRADDVDGDEGLREELGEFVGDYLIDFVGREAVDMQDGFGDEPTWALTMQRQNGDDLATIEVWDRGGDEPLVLRRRPIDGDPARVGFVIGTRNSKLLRGLWQ